MNATKRIKKEADQLSKRPCREFLAYPSKDSDFIWMFTMKGPDDGCYKDGVYHGKLILPNNYPYAPPDVMLITPNGRFECSKKICLSEVTSYHPENWQPSWGVHTVLLALREFMSTPGNNAIGAIEYSVEERYRLARESRNWVSEEGAIMKDHLAMLDRSPPWAERHNVPREKEEPTTPVSPELQKIDSPGATPGNAAMEPAPAPAPAPVPEMAAAPAQQLQQTHPELDQEGAWQVQESSLNNAIMVCYGCCYFFVVG
eukprot:TRINITY_DN647_c1_g3_i1.p1 TRINITY_DN647_c1_g3~~TRINITY_DN647_c1_g3_i1.p1  ORF type:complete len:274 (+),score=41.40 TRINITY_DN647_c1_g3_i1:49-822(+)